MKTLTHTPGPWKYGFESVDPNWAIVTNPSGSIVANVNNETGPDSESFPATRKMPAEANARLIAAAPELLAALIELTDLEGPLPGNPAWFATARAAIAKATS